MKFSRHKKIQVINNLELIKELQESTGGYSEKRMSHLPGAIGVVVVCHENDVIVDIKGIHYNLHIGLVENFPRERSSSSLPQIISSSLRVGSASSRTPCVFRHNQSDFFFMDNDDGVREVVLSDPPSDNFQISPSWKQLYHNIRPDEINYELYETDDDNDNEVREVELADPPVDDYQISPTETEDILDSRSLPLDSIKEPSTISIPGIRTIFSQSINSNSNHADRDINYRENVLQNPLSCKRCKLTKPKWILKCGHLYCDDCCRVKQIICAECDIFTEKPLHIYLN